MARALPNHAGEVLEMDTFFVRKQIIAGALLFACFELGVVLVRFLAR